MGLRSPPNASMTAHFWPDSVELVVVVLLRWNMHMQGSCSSTSATTGVFTAAPAHYVATSELKMAYPLYA